MSRGALADLAHRFFVLGSLHRGNYGAAPLVQFNEHQKTSVDFDTSLIDDVRLFERILGIGFFFYGPRLWMVGEIEPLKALQVDSHRAAIVERMLAAYPTVRLPSDAKFYRIRTFPAVATAPAEYDAPPLELAGQGRLDSPDMTVLYGSADLQVCLHECRVASEDDIYVATLRPTRELKLLDLSAHIEEEEVTEFESLDLAVQMLFLAAKHSYPHTRAVARAIRDAGYDGVLYPSYFSLLRTGAVPFETIYGISVRRFPGAKEREKWKTMPNIALFGRPVEDGRTEVISINRLVLRHVGYGFEMGPVFDMSDRAAGQRQKEALQAKLNASLQSAGIELSEDDWAQLLGDVESFRK